MPQKNLAPKGKTVNAVKYLKTNLQWTFTKKICADLRCQPTTKKQLWQQMERLSANYFPLRKAVDVLTTEFCLNKIALSRSRSPLVKAALGQFDAFWQEFVRIKHALSKKYMLFPCNGETRVESIAKLICRCTQFAASPATMAAALERAENAFDLTEREREFLPDVLSLYKIKLYCRLTEDALKGDCIAKTSLAKMLKLPPLKHPFENNDFYRAKGYCDGEIAVQVDCLGNSAAKLNGIIMPVDVKTYLFRNGRNAFDTFCKSRFGNAVAEFCSETPSCKLKMQYFVANGCEVRKYLLTNLCKRKSKYKMEFSVGNGEKTERFVTADTTCFDCGGGCFAPCLLCDDELIPCEITSDGKICLEVEVGSGKQCAIDLVCLYAPNAPALAKKIDDLRYFGSTCCPYLADDAADCPTDESKPLHLTPCGHVLQDSLPPLSTQIKFSYQLGTDDLSTFVDNGGQTATLYKGFVFGLRGEGVYAAQKGLLRPLFAGKFRFEKDKLQYLQPKCKLTVYHAADGENRAEKIYRADYEEPTRTLFWFKFERPSVVTKRGNNFCVTDSLGSYEIKCEKNIESFTTDCLECNSHRLRYKLSGNLAAGNCLAVCFAPSVSAVLRLSVVPYVPKASPLICDSLLSTYLNYVNNKNVFCLCNGLKRATALEVAAICYTNPQFVKDYLLAGKSFDYYYDNRGKKVPFCDDLALPLALFCYANLAWPQTNDELLDDALTVLLSAEKEGKDACVQALALKKALCVVKNRKTECVIKLEKLKKIICTSPNAYAYAQAIGAMPLLSPSKQRLKDLCAAHGVPKAWYYVSQIENLYGLKTYGGRVAFCPTVCAENVLENIVLTIDGKRIDTVFAKAATQSMTLNGVTCFQPFALASLKNANNSLIVRY